MIGKPTDAMPLRTFLAALTLAAAFSIFPGPAPAAAELGAVANSVPSADLVGKGRMTFLGFRVFDAELYAPGGTYSPSRPFALRLTYLRNFKGADIARSSEEEMRKQRNASSAQLAAWRQQMERIFPNVSKGQTITGVRTANGTAEFYLGNRKIGSINDPAFANSFFAIWLGDNTRNPRLRAQLIGAGD